MDREIRVFPLQRIEVRAGEGDELATIEGYAAVYGVLSEDLGGFREIIEPGFFEDVLSDDVRSLFNHDQNLILGRTKSGTLELTDEAEGLGTRTLLPNTSYARDLQVSMGRGDVDQMSFAFSVKREGGDKWEKREDGVIVRTLLRGGARRLFDISPVTYPAYPQTSAQVRSMVSELAAAGAADGDEGEAGGSQGRIEVLSRRLDLLELE